MTPLAVNLTNRMCFSVVCTLIDNDTRHDSGQNVVDSRGAASQFPQQISQSDYEIGSNCGQNQYFLSY